MASFLPPLRLLLRNSSSTYKTVASTALTGGEERTRAGLGGVGKPRAGQVHFRRVDVGVAVVIVSRIKEAVDGLLHVAVGAFERKLCLDAIKAHVDQVGFALLT